jgi:hypothetical protein
MKNNEYDAAEVVEIGAARAIVQGEKTVVPDLDSSGMGTDSKTLRRRMSRSFAGKRVCSRRR